MSKIIRTNSVTSVIDGYPYTIEDNHPKYKEIRQAVIDGISDKDLLALISYKAKGDAAIETLELLGITYKHGAFMYGNLTLPMDLGRYISASLDYDNPELLRGLVNFVKLLFNNPSHDTRHRLFSFMERNNLPITTNGHFMGFKVVTHDYLDKHTRTINNAPGSTVPFFSWSQVDTDPDRTCSYGYHVCSREYLPAFYSYGDRIISVSVDPSDVGAIPADYNGSKIRCRHYKIIADVTDRCVADLKLATLYDDEAITPFDNDEASLDPAFYNYGY
jgi:hypothetical protein